MRNVKVKVDSKTFELTILQVLTLNSKLRNSILNLMQMSFENGLEIRHIVLALKVNVVLMLIPRSKDKSNYQMQ